jgi:hypothetical protein
MKPPGDPVAQAIALVKEYQQFLRAGILVPQALVDQAHRQLHEAIAAKRREALERREQRKQQVKDAEDVHHLHPS